MTGWRPWWSFLLAARQNAPALLIALIGSIASLLAADKIGESRLAELQARLALDTSERTALLGDRLDRAALAVRALDAFITIEDRVSAEEFDRFAGDIADVGGVLRSLQWVSAVEAEDREQFESRAYPITQPGEDAEPIPAPGRDTHYPLRHAVRSAANRAGLASIWLGRASG